MYTTIIHPIRVALSLSLNEYCVLDSIYRLSQNIKYGGWCVQSKANLAKDLDLGDRVIFTIIKTLEEKDLIERNDQGNLRTKDSWNEMMANKHDYYVALDGKESQFISGRAPKQEAIPPYAESADTMHEMHTTYAESADQPMHNLHTTIRTNNNTTTTTKVVGKDLLIKWLSSFEDVKSPKGLAYTYRKKYTEQVIGRALKNSTCTSTAAFSRLCDKYSK